MPQDKDFKRIVRARMAGTGERYTNAREALGRHRRPIELGSDRQWRPYRGSFARDAAIVGRRAQLSTAEEVLGAARAATDGGWQLESRFATGALGGAWRVRDGSAVAVLKWHGPASSAPYNPDAPAIVTYLRASGYPTPAWLASGVGPTGIPWSLQELIDGEPLRGLDLRSAKVFLDLVELHRSLTPPTEMTWTPYMHEYAFTAHPSHHLLAEAGGQAARVLDSALALAIGFVSLELPDKEFVHCDLAVSNVLMRDGEVAGVIDMDGAGRGCAVYDALSPAVSGVAWNSDPRAIDRLVRYARQTYGAGPSAVAASTLAIELTVWLLTSRAPDFDQKVCRLLAWLNEMQRQLV